MNSSKGTTFSKWPSGLDVQGFILFKTLICVLDKPFAGESTLTHVFADGVLEVETHDRGRTFLQHSL